MHKLSVTGKKRNEPRSLVG